MRLVLRLVSTLRTPESDSPLDSSAIECTGNQNDGTDDGVDMTNGNRFCERKREKAQLEGEDAGSIVVATGEDEALHASGENPGQHLLVRHW